MTRRATRWRVTVAAPRARDGEAWILRIRPPFGAVDELGKPVLEARRSSQTKDRSEADELARQLERDLNSASETEADPLFADLLVFHEQHRRPLVASTLEKFAQARRHLERLLPGLRVSEVQRATLLRMRDGLVPDMAPSTVNGHLAMLASAWSWLRERERVPHDWPRIKRLKKQESDKRPFERDELVGVLRWVRGRAPRWLPLFVALADSGGRVSETLAARGKQLDRGTGRLRLLRQTTKGQRTRDVFLGPESLALIGDVEDDAPLFPSNGARRGKPATRRGAIGVLLRALRDLELDDGTLDLHSLRRSWIADAERSGQPRTILMRLSGHRDETTYKGYDRNTRGDDLARVAAAVRETRADLFAVLGDASQGASPSRGGIEEEGAGELCGAGSYGLGGSCTPDSAF